MMSHTPGPWKLGCYAGSNITLVLGADDSIVVRNPENRDDARLIVAAPELLEAAEDVLDQYRKSIVPIGPDLSDSIRVFLADAVRKAKGERSRHAPPMPWERA